IAPLKVGTRETANPNRTIPEFLTFRLYHRPGGPSLNRFLIQGWDSVNLTPKDPPLKPTVILSAAQRSRKIRGCSSGRWPAHQPRRDTMSHEKLCPVHRGLIAMNGRVALDFETWIAGCPIHESLFDSWVGYHEPPLTLPAGCPILESPSNSRVGDHETEPMREPLDINFFCNARGSCSIPEVRRLPLSHLQLLSKAAGRGRSLHDLRARARKRAPAIRICRCRLCSDARACSFARGRARGVVPGNRASNPETANFKETEAGRGDSVLTAAILRLQRAQRVEARGKAAIHAPQPGQARSCGQAGRLAMVQLSALRNGEDERGGDRVGVDRPTTGREQGFGKGASVNPTLRKVREGWGTRQRVPNCLHAHQVAVVQQLVL